MSEISDKTEKELNEFVKYVVVADKYGGVIKRFDGENAYFRAMKYWNELTKEENNKNKFFMHLLDADLRLISEIL